MPTKIMPEKVIIIWSSAEKLDKGIVHTLNSYTGTRVYEKDRYDGRLGEGVPYIETYQEAEKYMRANPDKPVQIPYSVGKKLDIV